VPREGVTRVVIALWRVAVALGPARIAIAVPAVPAVLIRSLSLATRTAPKRRRTIVIAVGPPGATAAYTAQLIPASFLITRVEITRVEIKHNDLRMNQSP
jgi:hypothetical protein